MASQQGPPTSQDEDEEMKEPVPAKKKTRGRPGCKKKYGKTYTQNWSEDSTAQLSPTPPPTQPGVSTGLTLGLAGAEGMQQIQNDLSKEQIAAALSELSDKQGDFKEGWYTKSELKRLQVRKRGKPSEWDLMSERERDIVRTGKYPPMPNRSDNFAAQPSFTQPTPPSTQPSVSTGPTPGLAGAEGMQQAQNPLSVEQIVAALSELSKKQGVMYEGWYRDSEIMILNRKGIRGMPSEWDLMSERERDIVRTGKYPPIPF